MLHFVLESCAEMGAREHLSILAYGFIFFIPLLLLYLYFLCLLICFVAVACDELFKNYLVFSN